MGGWCLLGVTGLAGGCREKLIQMTGDVGTRVIEECRSYIVAEIILASTLTKTGSNNVFKERNKKGGDNNNSGRGALKRCRILVLLRIRHPQILERTKNVHSPLLDAHSPTQWNRAPAGEGKLKSFERLVLRRGVPTRLPHSEKQHGAKPPEPSQAGLVVARPTHQQREMEMKVQWANDAKNQTL